MKTSCFKLMNRITQGLRPRQSLPRGVAALIVMAVASGLAFSSSAALVDVDVYVSGGWTFSGAGVLGSAGDLWNELSASTPNLKDVTGATTAVGISISGNSGTYASTGGTAPTTSTETGGLLGDYLNLSGGTMTIKLTGLRPNSPYNLVDYCAGNQTNQNPTITGAITATMGWISRGAFIQGENYAQNTSAISDANGTLTFASYASGWQGWNGLQVSGDIPLPSSFGGYPNIRLGEDSTVTLSIPAALNQITDFTVSVTNGNPATLSLPAAVNNVLNLTFAKGASTTQSFTVHGVAVGSSILTASYPWPAPATIATLPASGIVGHWLAGQEDLTDTSAYTPAGTHDGVAVGEAVVFSSDVPPGYTGSSGNPNASGAIIQIENTSRVNDGAAYQPTFDTLTAKELSVAFWSKRAPNTTWSDWQPFVSKRGEGSIGWKVRKAGSNRVGCFTVRGTQGTDDIFTGATDVTDTNWHHFAATYDGITGVRKLYVDGKVENFIPNDFGSIGLASDAPLILGGQWSNDGSGGSAVNPFPGQLFDVRIYAVPLNVSQVQNLVSPNTTGIVAASDTPVVDLGKTGLVSVSIPDGANASQEVVVSVTNMTPGIVSVGGASGNVFTVTFAAGGSTTKTFVLTGLSEGQAQIGFGSLNLTPAVASLSVYGKHLIGQWLNGDESFADVSGFTAAGTHDGMISGNAANISFSTDVPPSKTGKSLSISATTSGILISNTSVFDTNYARTFDDVMANKCSVSLWVKGASFGGWATFLTKRGEDNMGIQVRRNGGNVAGAFTIRGTRSGTGDLGGTQTITDGQWHHLAAVWDGDTGVRQVYKDGVLDATLTNDFGPFLMAPNHHLMLAAREQAATLPAAAADYSFAGNMYDVRVYNYALSQADVKSLASLGAIRITIADSIKVGDTASISVTIPSGANDSQAVVVSVSTDNPSVASVEGVAPAVLTLTFAQGGALVQTVTVTGVADGKTTFSAASSGYATASETLTVWAPLTSNTIIGRWFSGQPTLADVSGFRPAGTHDGVAVGPDAASLSFANDVPAGYTGQSLDLTAGQIAIMITNTAVSDNVYEPTYDNQITNKFSVAFWAKGYPTAEWGPWLVKNGEDGGFQVRRYAAEMNHETFTLRGTAGVDDPAQTGVMPNLSDGLWHHYAAAWDGQTGLRSFYVDGALQFQVTGDTGAMNLPSVNHLVFGAREYNGAFDRWTSGQLFDVRVYNYAISPLQVGLLVKPPTALSMAVDYASLPMGETVTMKVAIPAGSNDTQPVTVVLNDNSPGVVTMAGAVNNVLTLTFPAGGLPVQTVTLLTVGPGAIDITATMGATSATLAAPCTVSNKKLIGRWVSGDSDLTDKSGFMPAGTHDGVAVGDNPELLAFTNDVPAGFSGSSLDLTANSYGVVGVSIANSSTADGAYQPTYDSDMANAFTVTCWAKGSPASYVPFVSKAGENNIGWQIRRGWINEAFAIRGTLGDDNGEGTRQVGDGKWHHYAGVWDGISGVRRLYVDGVLDVNYTGDFGPMALAAGQHLAIGAREAAAGWENTWFPGLVYDVRIYNYALSPDAVSSLTSPAALRITTAGPIKVGDTATISVSIPVGANDGQSVDVTVSTDTPGVASIVGASADVLTLTFAQGGALTQTVSVTGVADGKSTFSASCSGYPIVSQTLTVWSPAAPTLIGRWFAGQPTLADVSGFRPAGTHDGVAVGSSAASLSFIADVPAGYSGQSLDLSTNGLGGQLAVMITNTVISDNAYEPTYDNQITNKFSVAFWAKGYPASEWGAWLAKNGEDAGFQVRRYASDLNHLTFTLRGTVGDDDPSPMAIFPNLADNQWHHYASTWDGQTGVRSFYVDGALQFRLTDDTGAMSLPNLSHLVLGARDYNGSYDRWTAGQLFDVRVYSYAISPLEVGLLVQPPTALSIAVDYASLPVDETTILKVTIPAGSNDTQPVTVVLTNNSPNVVTLVGAVNNVLSLTFPACGLPVQTVTLVTVGSGAINITATMGAASATLAAPSTVSSNSLIGHWISGASDLTDKSGFTPTGTHDGVAVGTNPELLAFSSDVPAGFAGKSLDLTANFTATVGVSIRNSSSADAAYQPTYDDSMANAFTVSCWAKGSPGSYVPFVSKAGENNIGWQLRRGWVYEAFTVRGTLGHDDAEGTKTVGDGNWHHYVGVWDGISGIRRLYVDGVLDLEYTGDFGPMALAAGQHLAIGAREAPAGWENTWFPGLIYDVRVYNYAISPAEVAALQVGIPDASLTVRMGANNTVVISWPSNATGYVLQSSSVVNSGWSDSTLTPVSQNGQYVVTDAAGSGAAFYRLVYRGN